MGNDFSAPTQMPSLNPTLKQPAGSPYTRGLPYSFCNKNVRASSTQRKAAHAFPVRSVSFFAAIN